MISPNDLLQFGVFIAVSSIVLMWLFRKGV